MPLRKRSAPAIEIKVDANDATTRDYVMARVAAAQAIAKDAVDALHDLVVLFLRPEEDHTGAKRAALLQEALESFGGATRALEDAEQSIGEVDNDEGEPWEDE